MINALPLAAHKAAQVYLDEHAGDRAATVWRRRFRQWVEDTARELIEEACAAVVDMPSDPAARLAAFRDQYDEDPEEWVREYEIQIREHAADRTAEAVDGVACYTRDAVDAVAFADAGATDEAYERMRNVSETLPESWSDLVSTWATFLHQEAVETELSDGWRDYATDWIEEQIAAAREDLADEEDEDAAGGEE